MDYNNSFKLVNQNILMALESKFKVKIGSEKCKGCGLCVYSCKQGVLEMSKARDTNKEGHNYAKVVNEKDCVSCADCAIVCADGCIEIYRENIKNPLNQAF